MEGEVQVIDAFLNREASVYRETNTIYSGTPGMTTILDFAEIDDFYCDVTVSGVSSGVGLTLTGIAEGSATNEFFSFDADGALLGSVKFDELDYMYTYPTGVTVTVKAVGSGGEPRVYRSLVGECPVRYRERRSTFQVIEPGGRESARFKFYCSPDADIRSQDLVVVDGMTFRVEADPYVVYDFVGPHHKEFNTILQEG